MANVINVYQYDELGFYIGETIAEESPLQPGTFLIPAMCTTIAPPHDVPTGKHVQLVGLSWQLVDLPAPPALEETGANVADVTLSTMDTVIDPVDKLKAFLKANPDVAELLK